MLKRDESLYPSNKSTPLLSMPARDALLHGSANKISSSPSSHIESEKYNFHFSALTSSTDTERGEITKKSIQTSNRVRFEITRRNWSQSSSSNTRCYSSPLTIRSPAPLSQSTRRPLAVHGRRSLSPTSSPEWEPDDGEGSNRLYREALSILRRKEIEHTNAVGITPPLSFLRASECGGRLLWVIIPLYILLFHTQLSVSPWHGF